MDWLLPLGFFALAGIGGGIFFYRLGAGGSGAPLWLIGWIALTLIGARIILLSAMFAIFCGCTVAGFAGGWAISRYHRRAGRAALICGWIALPVVTFLYVFWPRGPGSEMFGFAVILFAPVLFCWAIAALLGLTFRPRPAPRS